MKRSKHLSQSFKGAEGRGKVRISKELPNYLDHGPGLIIDIPTSSPNMLARTCLMLVGGEAFSYHGKKPKPQTQLQKISDPLNPSGLGVDLNLWPVSATYGRCLKHFLKLFLHSPSPRAKYTDPIPIIQVAGSQRTARPLFP